MQYAIKGDTDKAMLGDGHQQLASQIAVQITGTWTGTLTFKGSVDGVNRVAIAAMPIGAVSPVTTTTANGIWRLDTSGLKDATIEPTAGMTGTPVVTWQPVVG